MVRSALTSTLYRFRIEVSDVDRAAYPSLDLRVARHPSENEAYLLTRVIAYALSFEDDLELAPGLCAEDEPALFVRSTQGNGYRKWIEIGNPSARRLHKAAKASEQVQVYTYKDPANLAREVAGERVHRIERIEVYALAPEFLDALARGLEKDNAWALFRQEGELTISVGEQSYSTTLRQVPLVGRG